MRKRNPSVKKNKEVMILFCEEQKDINLEMENK